MAEVFKSTVIDAPADRVWALLRDFNHHDRWHPAVAYSEIENGKAADQVGCVRRFRLRDGGVLRERLLALSDDQRSFTYCIIDSPIPLLGYVANLTIKSITDGERALWIWSSQFDTPPGREAELMALVGEQIYQAGFESVRSILGQGPIERRETTNVKPASRGVAPARAVSSSADAIQCGAIVVHRYGGPEELRWETTRVPPPGPGEVRIRHHAIGLNYIDVYCRSGQFALLEPPGIPGMEAVGEILDVGAVVNGILPGDRVGYACTPVGAYAEARTMKADLLVVIPDDIDDETAAAALLKGMTAEFLLHRVHRVKEGDIVLVHAAAGGVGLFLCQWARHLGATVIGTVSTREKARLAREHGCAYPIIYTEEDFVDSVRELTDGHGADVVFDAVGRETFMNSFKALAIRGHLVSYGQASGPIESTDIANFAAKSATLSRPNFGHYTSTPHEVRAITDRLFDAFRNGVLTVRVGQQFPLRQARDAHRALEARATSGSTILVP